MGLIRKRTKFNLLGTTILIELSYPSNHKKPQFAIPRSYIINTVFVALILLLFAFISTQSSHLFTAYTYKTSIMPFSTEVYQSVTHPIELKAVRRKPQQMIFHGERSKKQVALTFDADMTPQMMQDLRSGNVASYYDKDLIDVLINNQTKATLFMSGMWIESYASAARDLSRNPLFELGNHTYSHPAFHNACYGLSQVHPDEKNYELSKTQRLLKNITGKDNKLFRFPGGCYSQRDLDIVTNTGQVAIQWDVAGQDGFNGNTAQIVANVVENVKNGSIIVLHMNGYPNEPATVHALPLIISALRAQNYEFVTVSEMLGYENEQDKNVHKLFSLKIN